MTKPKPKAAPKPVTAPVPPVTVSIPEDDMPSEPYLAGDTKAEPKEVPIFAPVKVVAAPVLNDLPRDFVSRAAGRICSVDSLTWSFADVDEDEIIDPDVPIDTPFTWDRESLPKVGSMLVKVGGDKWYVAQGVKDIPDARTKSDDPKVQVVFVVSAKIEGNTLHIEKINSGVLIYSALVRNEAMAQMVEKARVNGFLSKFFKFED